MSQRLFAECQDSDGDCRVNVAGFYYHNTLHMRNLILRLQNELEWHRYHAANQVCDGAIDFLRVLFHEFADIKSRFPKEQDLQEHLLIILELITTVINQLSNMRGEFRPVVLDWFGLARAVENEISCLCSRTDITSKIYISNRNLNFKPDFEATLFRVIEQALSNIEKHAKASEVMFVYGMSDCNKLLLEIRDNGIGIPREKLHATSSVGLISMREQVAIVDGEIDILPMANAGTLILISIPETGWKKQITYFEQMS